ncbi:MAG: DUF3341 domain-containing protein [Candidatus Kapabacteria bacterium]|nr:DUF3341 domain-containing protein [Candidatus Kapabacteria bacterium]
MDKKLYSVAATFGNADDIILATGKIASAGYTNYDVNTPYPIHGMDDAMRLKPSKIGYFTITFGLTGTALILWLMYWVTTTDYPQVIGGKPFFALPAFIPITFEATVLLAAVGSALSLFIYFFKFPNNSHPLHDTEYMKSCSSDKYGIYVEAKDPLFDEVRIKALMHECGAENVYDVNYEEDFLTAKFEIFDKKFIGALIVLAIIVSASTYLHLNKLLYMTPFNWMMDQPKVSAQQKSTFFADGFGMRTPVEGTVARGNMPYAYKGQPDEAGKYLTNPLQNNDKNLALGKAKFLTFCSPCHGNTGMGDSRLNGQFPNGPTLHSDKVTNWPDGNLYHVITEGQNVMPGYFRQVTKDERWAIVLYLRTLQRALNAKEGDLK